MRSRKYWINRAAAAEFYAQQDASLIIEEIQKLYCNALEYIDEEVQKLRRELGKQTGAVTAEELNQMLNPKGKQREYRELTELLAMAETEEERADILSRMNAQAYGARIKRIDSVGNKILAEFTKVASMERVLCRELFSDTYQKGFYGKIYELAEGYNAGVAFDVLPRRAINKALSECWHGENYSSRIWKHGQGFAEQIQQTVVKGLMTGQSRAKLASELMGYTESTRYVAERLVRTETAHFLSEGQREAYKAAGIEKYRYLAALSERTCEVCASLDNKVFSLDEATEGVNYPPMHPNCRCVTITADAKLKERLARDPETGENYKIDGKMNFQQWKESLSDEQKSAINKYVDNSDKRGIIKRKRVSIDNMRNEKPLTKSQIEETIDYAVRLGMPRELIRYSDAYYTSYGCNFDILCIGTDVYPTELKRKKANSRVSNKGAIAHEIVGHRETVLKGWAQADEVLDEIQASIRAARFAPELTKVERITLFRDAVERARDNGIVLKNIKDKLYINER